MLSSSQATARRRLVGGLLILAGLLLLASWGIRAYILRLTAPGDPWLWVHAAITLVSLAAAVWLLHLGYRTLTRRIGAADGRWLAAAGLWILAIGLNRLVLVLTKPDPNPRAHLHLSVLFIVIGGALLGMAWLWKRLLPA
ncbi:MAG: hypothetical protein AB1515_02215 [Nitrospirota bacterium]